MDELARLMARIARLERQSAQALAPQLPSSSMPGAVVQTEWQPTGDVDEDGDPIYVEVPKAVVGALSDGTHGVQVLDGPTPSAPSEPIVVAGPGFISVEWDGLFEDGLEAPLDFSHVAVHVAAQSLVDDEDVVMPSPETLRSTIHDTAGAAVVIGDLEEDSYYVSLVTVTTAGVWSEPAPYSTGGPGEYSVVDVPALEARIDAANAKATQALSGLSGKITTFYAPSEPTTSVTGDLWIRSSDQRLFRWSGSAWVEVKDSAITAAQATADGSRLAGSNLVINGNAELGNLTNFSSFQLVTNDQPTGTAGSFRRTVASSVVVANNAITWHLGESYEFSFYARQTVAGATGRLYGMVMPLDIDGQAIEPRHIYHIAGTLTTLAADLKPGDTTVTLTSAAGWYGSAAKPANANSYLRSLIVYNYVNGKGYAWGPGTYSRNVYGTSGGLWNDGSVDTSTGVITLKTAWTGATIPAGTSVANGTSGGTYAYMPSVQNVQVPEAWTKYSATFAPAVMPDQNPVSANASVQWGMMPAATATIRVGWLLNYPPNTGAHAIAGVIFSPTMASQSAASKAIADAAAAAAKADGKAATYIQGTAPTGLTSADIGDIWFKNSVNPFEVYTWSGSAWVVSGDKTARDAADAAQATADDAVTAAQAADQKAILAQASADGKSTNYYSTLEPDPLLGGDGDTWWQYDVDGVIIGVWERKADAWAARAIGNEVIDAISAGKITTGTLGVGVSINVGDPSGAHLVIDASGPGITVYRPDGDGGLEPSTVLGGEVDQFAINKDGMVLAGISPDGGISGQSLSIASDQVTIDGENLHEKLWEHAWGYQGGFTAPDDSIVTVPTAEVGRNLMNVKWRMVPGRQYEIRFRMDVVTTGMMDGGRIYLGFHYGVNKNPAHTDPRIEDVYLTYPKGASANIFRPVYGSFLVPYIAAVEQTGAIVVNMRNPSWSSAAYNTWTGYLYRRSWFSVYDVGPYRPQNSTDSGVMYTAGSGGGSGDTAPPAVQTYVKTYACTWGKTWDGGTSYTAAGQEAWQGAYSGRQYRGQLGYQSWVSDVSGATITKVEVYLYCRHTYYGSGANIGIGVHSNASAPSGFTGATGTTTVHFAKPEGKWVTLPSTWYPSFANGTWKGISINPDGVYTTAAYAKICGTYEGSGHVASQVRITYKK